MKLLLIVITIMMTTLSFALTDAEIQAAKKKLDKMAHEEKLKISGKVVNSLNKISISK